MARKAPRLRRRRSLEINALEPRQMLAFDPKTLAAASLIEPVGLAGSGLKSSLVGPSSLTMPSLVDAGVQPSLSGSLPASLSGSRAGTSSPTLAASHALAASAHAPLASTQHPTLPTTASTLAPGGAHSTLSTSPHPLPLPLPLPTLATSASKIYPADFVGPLPQGASRGGQPSVAAPTAASSPAPIATTTTKAVGRLSVTAPALASAAPVAATTKPVSRITGSTTALPTASSLVVSRPAAASVAPTVARPNLSASIRPYIGVAASITSTPTASPTPTVTPTSMIGGGTFAQPNGIGAGSYSHPSGAGMGAMSGSPSGSTSSSGSEWATYSSNGSDWTSESSGWNDTIGWGTDGYGGNYLWDDRTTWDTIWSVTSGVGRVDGKHTETYTLHDSGGAITEDENYQSNSVGSGVYPPNGQTVLTEHDTSSDTFSFEDKDTGAVSATGVSGQDSFDDTQKANQTTDSQSVQTYDGQGGMKSQSSETDQGSETFTTSDNGTATLSGASTGSDQFGDGTSNSDNWTHAVNANSSSDASGNNSSSSTTTDTDTGTDSENDGVQGGDSFTSGSSGGTDNFNDGESSSDQYNVSVTAQTDQSEGVSSNSISATLMASGQQKASDEDQGGDTNGDGSSDNFDGTYGDKEVWTTDESASNSSDGQGGGTASGSANDTDSDVVTIQDNGGDSGPISDNSALDETATGNDSVEGSWSVAVSPGGATTNNGSVTYDNSVSDVIRKSNNGGDSGDTFQQEDDSIIKSDSTGTNYADGSDKYKDTADGTDSTSFDLSGPDAGGTASLDESDSDQWTSVVSGADAADGSGSTSFSASDSGSDSGKDSGSGSASTPITGGTETNNVVLNESSSDNYSDDITGNASFDAFGNVTGNESYFSTDSGQDQTSLTDSGGDSLPNTGGGPQANSSFVSLTRINPIGGSSASDSYSLHGTDSETYLFNDSGSMNFGPSGTSGADTLTSHVVGSDSFGGTASATVTPSEGPADNFSLTLSGSDAETLDETDTTTSNPDGSSTSTVGGTDSGTDNFDLSDSDANNTYTEDDSDSYDDPVGVNAGSANPMVAGISGASASGIQPAGAGAGDRSSSTHSGTPPGGWDSPALAAVGGFFGNLWDRATFVPKTVWANTEGDGFASRVYTTAGTTVGSLVGVTQVSDAFSQHDAVDGHEQTTSERVLKGITGTVQLATVGVGAAGKLTSAVIPSKVSSVPMGSHGPATSWNGWNEALAGGPVRNLNTNLIKVTDRGIGVVEQHLSRFGGPFKANSVMVDRLKQIARGNIRSTPQDLNFYSHELREYTRYRRLGWKNGLPGDEDAALDLWRQTHTATLGDYGFPLRSEKENLFHPLARPLYGQ